AACYQCRKYMTKAGPSYLVKAHETNDPMTAKKNRDDRVREEGPIGGISRREYFVVDRLAAAMVGAVWSAFLLGLLALLFNWSGGPIVYGAFVALPVTGAAICFVKPSIAKMCAVGMME
ncbi:MAG: hypothetical protein AAGA69_12610, partial [Pseudomonadota bacterium]